jgi:hypothetical protein
VEDLIDEEQWKEKDVIIKSLNLPYLDKPITRFNKGYSMILFSLPVLGYHQ